MHPHAVSHDDREMEFYARSIVASVLDRLCVPYLALAHDGTVLWANEMSRAILGHRQHVALGDDGRLMFPEARSAEEFAHFLGKPAIDGTEIELAVLGGFDGVPMYLSLCWYQLPEYPGMPGIAPIVVVFFRDASREEAIETMRVRYGLSEREIRVVRAVLDGSDLRDYAQEHRVSIHTVRKQFNTAMNKTGVSSRFQLRSLIDKLTRSVALP